MGKILLNAGQNKAFLGLIPVTDQQLGFGWQLIIFGD